MKGVIGGHHLLPCLKVSSRTYLNLISPLQIQFNFYFLWKYLLSPSTPKVVSSLKILMVVNGLCIIYLNQRKCIKIYTSHCIQLNENVLVNKMLSRTCENHGHYLIWTSCEVGNFHANLTEPRSHIPPIDIQVLMVFCKTGQPKIQMVTVAHTTTHAISEQDAT